MDLSWTVDRAGDASLVRCRVRNDDAAPRRVRVESRFDAPVLPPRRAGTPVDGWDESGVTLRVDPDERQGFGFAVPVSPVDPPVEIADVAPIDPGERIADPDEDGGTAGSTAADALRELAEHRPPRAAVDGDREVDDYRDDAASVGNACAPGGERDGPERDADGSERAAPAAIDDWFDAVEARLARAERLADADVETATEVVADAGGVGALADLDDRLTDDAERLRTVSERAASLAERADATDVPIGALERLA
ncbi:hypothetical protein [Halorubrum yunnanense]|uniref:DUF8080 domain-containing protein n=1 Tax=Halorubrum yunnanense TaxID=1526162 RepID=A0ABD5YC43_9EURY|nr:hypothetical protein [Halorubrum yunnanense]